MREDKRIRCNDCDNHLKEDEFVHTINYGSWNPNSNGFKDGGQKELYCRECWQERSPMQVGMKYEVDNVEELIGILESSNGDLVADFNSHCLGTRVYMRIIEDRSEFAYVNTRYVGEKAIGFTSSYKSKSINEGREFINNTLMSGDLPPLIVLVSSENTPFSEYPDRANNQSQIHEF
jgi:hypothetical protein